MLLKVFRGTGPAVILLIIITLGLLWISAFINPQPEGSLIYETKPMPLYGVLKYLVGGQQLSGVIFTFVLMVVLLFLIGYFNTSVFFINERTFLPVLVYALFSAVFPQMQTLNPALPAAVFLMLAQIRIMEAYKKQGIAFNFFDAGLLISTGSLFYANLIWFGIIILIGIAILRTGNIKEVAISFLGLITPYVIVIGMYYVLGNDIRDFFNNIRENLFADSPGYTFMRITVVVLIYISLIILLSIGFLIPQLNSKKIVARKTFYLLLWILGLSLGLYFFMPNVSVEIVWIAGIPASYFLVHYFVFVRKKIVPEIFFTGIYLLVLLTQILYIF